MKNPKITIIDYGIGNVHSVYNSIKALGYKKILISDKPKEIKESDVLILPGVGEAPEPIGKAFAPVFVVTELICFIMSGIIL